MIMLTFWSFKVSQSKTLVKPSITFVNYFLSVCWICSRKNFVCLACKLFWPLVSSYNFTQWGWRIPFGSDDFSGHIEFGENPPNYLFLSNLRAGRTSFGPLPSIAAVSLHYEESLIHGPLSLLCLTKGSQLNMN